MREKLSNLADTNSCMDVLDLHLWVDMTHTEEDEIARREKLFSDHRLNSAARIDPTKANNRE